MLQTLSVFERWEHDRNLGVAVFKSMVVFASAWHVLVHVSLILLNPWRSMDMILYRICRTTEWLKQKHEMKKTTPLDVTSVYERALLIDKLLLSNSCATTEYFSVSLSAIRVKKIWFRNRICSIRIVYFWQCDVITMCVCVCVSSTRITDTQWECDNFWQNSWQKSQSRNHRVTVNKCFLLADLLHWIS